MSKETFVWHPDEDDVYDGDVYGDTRLDDRPCSAFRKGVGKSFTMIGDGILTLAPIPQDIDVFVDWGATPGPWIDNPAVTRIAINSGTLKLVCGELEPTAVAVLGLGTEDAVTEVDITGTFIVRDINVAGSVVPSERPGSTINVYPNGTFLVGWENSTLVTNFGGAFNINVHDLGSMSVTASFVDLPGGTYVIGGPSTAANSSLEIAALPAAKLQGSPTSGDGGNRDGAFLIANHRISCRSASVSRLRAISMSCTSTHIKVEDTASLSIACNSIAFDGAIVPNGSAAFETGTIFAAGQGSAAITFTGSRDGPAPFDFKNTATQYPKGLFNFITKEGANRSKFRFLGIGSAFDFAGMLQKGLIAVDGMPDDGSKTAWRMESGGEGPSKSYFTVYLK